MNEIAIVTGGGSGIGRAAAIKLAAAGYNICIMDLKETRAISVKEEIERLGREVMIIDTDVKDEARIKKGFDDLQTKLAGKVTVVAIVAGINGTLSSIEELSEKDWDNTLNTNLKSTFLFVKHSIPYMKQHGGSIIITSSINGNRMFSNIGMSAYSTSKAGQVAFMKMAALELARYHIRVNAICPGAIDTNIGENTNQKENLKEVSIRVEYPDGNQPLEKKAGSAEQVAELILFLASRKSNHITGTEIFIDGAESLL